jgi:hypothetical protein
MTVVNRLVALITMPDGYGSVKTRFWGSNAHIEL